MGKAMAFSRVSMLRSCIRAARPTASRPQIFRQIARRGYASGGHESAKAGGDAIWAAGAVAVTAPACWWILSNSPDTSHGHGDHGGHGKEHEEEHKDEAEEESKDSPRMSQKPRRSLMTPRRRLSTVTSQRSPTVRMIRRIQTRPKLPTTRKIRRTTRTRRSLFQMQRETTRRELRARRVPRLESRIPRPTLTLLHQSPLVTRTPRAQNRKGSATPIPSTPPILATIPAKARRQRVDLTLPKSRALSILTDPSLRRSRGHNF